MNPLWLQANAVLAVVAALIAISVMIFLPMRRLTRFIMYGSLLFSACVLLCLRGVLKAHAYEDPSALECVWYGGSGVLSLVILGVSLRVSLWHREKSPCSKECAATIRGWTESHRPYRHHA